MAAWYSSRMRDAAQRNQLALRRTTKSSAWPLYTPPGEMALARTPQSAQYVAR